MAHEMTSNLVEESIEDFKNRYRGFGKMTYNVIADRLPHVYEKLKFYKYKNPRLTYCDSFAIFQCEKHHFKIQLEAYGEVVILWNDKKQLEYGSWTENPYDEVIKAIEEVFLAS